MRSWPSPLLLLCLCACRTSLLPPNRLDTAGDRDPGEQGPYGVSILTDVHARLAGQNVIFDVYLPQSAPPAPIVVVSHGFSNGRADMSDWGKQLGSWGFVTVIPSWPHTDGLYAEDNGESAVALLDWIQAQDGDSGGPLHGKLEGKVDGSRRGAVGHSFGGQVVLLAAELDPRIGVVVALDPVDGPFVNVALHAAQKIQGKLAVLLRADPSICNLNGSDQVALFDALTGPRLMAQVAHASHCDPAQPGSWPCNIACGPTSPERARIFRRYTTAALLWGLDGKTAFQPYVDGTTLSADRGIAGFQSHLDPLPPKAPPLAPPPVTPQSSQ